MIIQITKMKRILFTILTIFFVNTIYSQVRTYTGTVVDNYDIEPVIGAPIVINDSIAVCMTGMDGSFMFETDIPVKKLSVPWFPSYEKVDLELSEDCYHIEFVLMVYPYYDFMSDRKVNKIRKKEFKKLPKIRRKAYEKGIFQSIDVCYKQEFLEL